jgi:outer membrane biogenesis lipoprotein LolB
MKTNNDFRDDILSNMQNLQCKFLIPGWGEMEVVANEQALYELTEVYTMMPTALGRSSPSELMTWLKSQPQQRTDPFLLHNSRLVALEYLLVNA